MIKGMHTGGFDWYGVLYLGIVMAVIFMPVLFGRRAPSPPADGSDDGKGGGPRRPPTPPLGGPPLPDAKQSRTRLRDHRRARSSAPVRRGRSLHRPRRPSRTTVG